jgi:AraC family transcriptional regulator
MTGTKSEAADQHARLNRQVDELVNSMGVKPIVHVTGMGSSPCCLVRWKGVFTEYSTPKFTFPFIALQRASNIEVVGYSSNHMFREAPAMPGDLTIIPSSYATQWAVNKEVDVTVIFFESKVTAQYLQSLFFRKLINEKESRYVISFFNAYLYSTLSHLGDILVEHSNIHQEYLDAHFKTIEMYLTNFLGQESNTPHPLVKTYTTQVNCTLKALSTRLNRKILIEDIAEGLGVTQTYLSRIFKEEVGMSPHQFLMRNRINRARQLLTETDIDIATIAEESGFSDQSHLTRCFTKEVGMPPAKFRQHVSKGLTILFTQAIH